MKKNLLLLTLVFTILNLKAKSQLYKIELDEKVNASTLIAEGQVVAQKSFWNDAHTMIFTANTIQLYKTFKGTISTQTIEILTQGGSVGTQSVDVSDLLALHKNQTGIFFCQPNSISLKSPTTGKIMYDVYSSDQGFLRYSFTSNTAYAPFANYTDIENNLYNQLQKLTGQNLAIINPDFSVAAMVKKQSAHIAITNGILGVVNSFSPTIVHAGALNDPSNNTLTINGSGFGGTPSGSCAINFIDANSNITTPSYAVAYNSPYIVSWSNNQIAVKVPTRAATGPIVIVLSDGTTVKSSQNLTVSFSVINGVFPVNGVDIVSESRLMNTNGNGGYTYQFSNSALGGGKNFSSDAAAATFGRAVATWQQLVGANLVQGSSTSTQAIGDDKFNLIEYDNNNTGVPVMAAGVLEATYNFQSACENSSPFFLYTAQKKGFDILIRNPSVSTGSTVSFENGPCFPGISSYDLETVMLHELGHALNLDHINDGYQQYPIGTTHINPGKLMHYAIVNYADRRSLDNSAYMGALYTVTPQNDQFSVCGLYAQQMTQKSFTVVSNDECPNGFPTTPTAPGTVVSFDLVHATSNELKDPAFTQVDCAGTGESVTNNAWYALKTTGESNGVLSLAVSGYATTPSTQAASCTGQGVRMAVYEVSSCPDGQSFPAPISCTTFTGNGNLTDIGGLLPNQTYLLYFDGLRNTKASFNITMKGSALPIVLSNFSGEYVKGTDQLYINIQQAINVRQIMIEKSANTYGFTQIGTLQILPTQLAGKHTYVDQQPFAGNNFYRLKIVDNDGGFEYSNIIKLTNTAGQLVYIYPNPVADNLSVSLSGVQAGKYHFTLYDVAGKAQLKNTYAITEGSQSLSIPVQHIAKGVYVIKITSANGAVIAQQKIVKQ